MRGEIIKLLSEPAAAEAVWATLHPASLFSFYLSASVMVTLIKQHRRQTFLHAQALSAGELSLSVRLTTKQRNQLPVCPNAAQREAAAAASIRT